ncbi:MAG: helix-turn-helix domain-containing protein [bacterium]|nr:helix-turn-helix domain-containing protein [bacterium]
MFEKYLRDIGLSDKEAAVYVALLSFDKAQISEISQKAKVKRPTTYVILDSLAKKGLVSETNIGKKTYYLAEPPEKLGFFVERQIHLLEENKKSLDIIIPQLRGLQGERVGKPIVQFFDGKEGVLSSNDDTFVKKLDDEPVYMVYPLDLVKDLFTEKETTNMREERISRGIRSKSIYTSKIIDKPSDSTGERIKIDHEKYPITSDITIYGDRVKIAILGKRLSGISVKSQEFAETLKSLIKYIFDHK